MAALETKYSLVLSFKTTEGSKVNLTIQDANPLVSQPEVAELMDVIIAQNIFETSKGDFAEKVEARLVAKNQDVYEIGN